MPVRCMERGETHYIFMRVLSQTLLAYYIACERIDVDGNDDEMSMVKKTRINKNS